MSIRIDGSLGEGGGQILRTSLSLSLVTGQPFRIDNIRAGRKKPGLLRQHLTAVLAAAEIGGAKVDGAVLGSQSVQFTPGLVRSGEYSFAIGTAGSATLVFQTILPPLMLASGSSKITLEGGTHNDSAPPYHFLERSFLPLVDRIGPRVALQFERYGFYPAGGGRFRAEITPTNSTSLRPLHIPSRGEITSRKIIAVVANLPYHIAQREMETAGSLLNWDSSVPRIVDTDRASAGPGNVVMIEIGSASRVTEIFTAFGKHGVTAERVAEQAVHEVREYLISSAAAGEHLTDQLLLPMALAGEGSFTATKLNTHARTNMDVIGKFLPVRFETVEQEKQTSITVTKRY
jgi:RNA 3'-terminal phosphate cyclase (ATP)